MERPRPSLRGGAVLHVGRFGPAMEFAEIWIVHPRTHEERVIVVHVQPELPALMDFVVWMPGSGAEWYRRGEIEPSAVFRRIGEDFDPAMQSPRTA